jgi:glycyl-tRNA synthetase beta chain
MGKQDFLLEIGMEEMPAGVIPGAIRQLEEKMASWLAEQRIAYGGLERFATPRRLAILVRDIAEKQEDLHQEIKGPARAIAVDEAGAWTKAALGFARSQGVAPEQLVFREVGGASYVFAIKDTPGLKTKQLLMEALPGLITGLHFPKQMRWGEEKLRYIRPIRWLVALLGDEVIPVEVAGVPSDRVTRGHRFLGQPVSLRHAAEYAERLKEQRVIASAEERRTLILEQVERLKREKGWMIPIDEDLLEEIVHLVEFPTVLYGSFDPAFLALPAEVLITSMREHQRYFPVTEASGRLLPYFVTVRNGDDRHLDVVRKGNEKVLRARLSDARFFFEEDQKMPIDKAVSRLEQVIFQEGLGTIGDKLRRLRHIALALAPHFGIGEKSLSHLVRAAEICKFDLVTQMVYEFPELEGVMGRVYARLAGEADEVAEAVFEHHLPRHAGDLLPTQPIATVLSLADKLDTLVGFFSLGMIPTGSQDPYALRRQANGVVQMLVGGAAALTVEELLQPVFEAYQEHQGLSRPAGQLVEELRDFLFQRLKYLLQEERVRHDCIEAVFASTQHVLAVMAERARVLNEMVERAESKAIFEAFTRVNNLAGKAKDAVLIAHQLTEKAEQRLYETWQKVRDEWGTIAPMDARKQLSVLAELAEPIHHFFQEVMVMVEDEEVRANRLALLKRIRDLTSQYADFSKLMI